MTNNMKYDMAGIWVAKGETVPNDCMEMLC